MTKARAWPEKDCGLFYRQRGTSEDLEAGDGIVRVS